MGDIPAWVNGAFQGALGGLNNQFAYCEQMWGLCAPQPQGESRHSSIQCSPF